MGEFLPILLPVPAVAETDPVAVKTEIRIEKIVVRLMFEISIQSDFVFIRKDILQTDSVIQIESEIAVILQKFAEGVKNSGSVFYTHL